MTPPILSNLDGLFGLSRQHGVDIKPTLLRVLTDLYIQKPTHSSDEESQYTTLALRLLDVVDSTTRAIVSQKLADYAGAPADVLRRLFGDEAELARTSEVQGATPPKEVDDAARNPPSTGGAQPDHMGSGTTAAELTALFFAVDSTERRLILMNLKYADAIAGPRMPPGDLEKSIRRLEESALGGRPGDFVREIERTLGITRMVAQRIVNDPAGEPIVVAAKSLGMPLPVLQRILLFVNPAVGHSVRRVYDLSALFDEIPVESARHLVALWRDPDRDASRPAHHLVSLNHAARRLREAAASNSDRQRKIDADDDLFLDRVQRTS